MNKAQDISGQTFFRLTAVAKVTDIRTPGTLWWFFRCSCGSELKARYWDVVNGKQKSCGCLPSRGNRKHGMSSTKEYWIWQTLLVRCRNPKSAHYKYYGARGVEVHFTSFEQFMKEIGPRPSEKHSVDRINNNGHYEPGNVRWATASMQCGNKRNNLMITWNGRTQHLAAWSRDLGIDDRCLRKRIVLFGWSIQRAFTEPVRRSSRTPT